MSTAHTLGPWEFVDNALVGPKIDDKPIWLRPVILRSEVGVRQSDAQLLAAAPELLEACNLFLEYEQTADADGMEMMFAYSVLKKAVYAAIAKATGVSA